MTASANPQTALSRSDGLAESISRTAQLDIRIQVSLITRFSAVRTKHIDLEMSQHSRDWAFQTSSGLFALNAFQNVLK